MTSKIVALDGLDAQAHELLKKIKNAEIEVLKEASAEQKIASASRAHVVLIRSATKATAEFFEKTRELKLIVRAGVGLDNVDVPAATKHGVIVMNTPSGNTITTAEHAIAMMMSLARQIPQATASMKAGKWEKKKFVGHELCRKTLGVLGLGNIGRIVAQRALGLGMKVVAFDPFVSAEVAARQNVEKVELLDLFSCSDFVTVHIPLTDHTKNLVDKPAFSKMKKGAFLIHCARGGIVDEKALLNALDSGQVAGAALDVFVTEPTDANDPLVMHPNVICTPHLGAATEEAQLAVSLEAAEQIRDFLEQGMIRNAVNHPNISAARFKTIGGYVTLAERMGDFLGQWSTEDQARVQSIELKYQGVEKDDQPLLTLSFLKGFLTPVFGDHVNFVNARTYATGHDMPIVESVGEISNSYTTMIQVIIKRAGVESLTLEGVVFGKKDPRFVRFNQFSTDAHPEGWVLVTINRDIPNMVGQIGTVLGMNRINIANMSLGRGPIGAKHAFALTSVDSQIPDQVLNELRRIPGIELVRQIHLTGAVV